MSQTLLLTFYGQVKSKKNSKQIGYRRNGQPFVRSNDAAKAQEQLMAASFRSDYFAAEIKYAPWQEASAYRVEVEVYNKDRKRHDLDNQLATIMDALVEAGVLRDDNQEVVPEAVIRYKGIDRLDPRAEITITTINQRKK